MAENLPPELYLSLLSGRTYDVSHISQLPRHNNIGPDIPGPFRNNPNRLTDLLDALASICVQSEKGEVFFVSLAMEPKSTTLYVSSNKSVPLRVINHLRVIRSRLQVLNAVLEFDPSIPTNSESLPNPNDTQSRREREFELEKTIYEHSYRKLRRRFLKRAPGILKIFPSMKKHLRDSGITNLDDLDDIQRALQLIMEPLRHDRSLSASELADVIELINAMGATWQDLLHAGGDEDILTQWDLNMIHVSSDANHTRTLSLLRLLEKLLILYHHIRTITRIAWSRRLSPFLDPKGDFKVVAVPAARQDISIKFSKPNIIPNIFPPGLDHTKSDVKETVYDKLLSQLQAKVVSEKLSMKKQELSMDVNVHAESNLLAYHLQHPDTNPYQYFGGSKLPCHGCATFFKSFNDVAGSFGHPQFFTKGSHNKIYLRWFCPSLLSPEQRIQLRGNEESIDTQVRRGMVAILRTELAEYVEELHAVATVPSPSLSDSTDASGDLHNPRRQTLRDYFRSHKSIHRN